MSVVHTYNTLKYPAMNDLRLNFIQLWKLVELAWLGASYILVKPLHSLILCSRYQLTSVALKSPSCYEICVEFNPANVRGGIHIVRVHVADTWFKLKATVGRLEDHKQLKPISKYKRGRRLDDSNWHRERLRRGEGLESTTNFKRIPGYDVPKEYRDQFDTANGDHVFLESLVRSKIPVELNVDTYETHWKYLLWHEELQIESVHITL